MENENNFGEDVAFLKRHVETIELRGHDGEAIVLVPAFQGRVMTSTATGDSGTSYGWLNYDCIQSDSKDPQINLYGGEERMWLGPEGGQYSLFFDPDAPMDFANWRTPSVIDTEPFEVGEQTDQSVQFFRNISITNYSRFEFQMRMERTVYLLSREQASRTLGDLPSGIQLVAHESHNMVTNIGEQAWTSENGLPGIWMLCMNKPSPRATVIVPYKRGSVEELGPIVNADYFGKLESDRLRIDENRGLIYFLGDGKLRSKLGLTYPRVESRLGSWDPMRGVLSVVEFNLPEEVLSGYTNNVWEMQDEPFNGDVINSYNDGPNESGGMLGPFFELESLSPALALAPGDWYTHIHRTIRIEGDRGGISRVAESVFGVGLDEIEAGLNS